MLQGWFEYFKHSKSNVFERVDGYTRARLRSILRKRRGGKGRGRGCDHHRWTNAFFHAHGLLSLMASYRPYLIPNARLSARFSETFREMF